MVNMDIYQKKSYTYLKVIVYPILKLSLKVDTSLRDEVLSLNRYSIKFKLIRCRDRNEGDYEFNKDRNVKRG